MESTLSAFPSYNLYATKLLLTFKNMINGDAEVTKVIYIYPRNRSLVSNPNRLSINMISIRFSCFSLLFIYFFIKLSELC